MHLSVAIYVMSILYDSSGLHFILQFIINIFTNHKQYKTTLIHISLNDKICIINMKVT